MDAPKRVPPKKATGKLTGPRRINGALGMDVETFSAAMGWTSKTTRAQIARGLLPYRRLGSRIIISPAQVEEMFQRLPGVSVDQALANVQAREGVK